VADLRRGSDDGMTATTEDQEPRIEARDAKPERAQTAEIKEVRAEVSASGCQHLPMLLDKTWDVAPREIVNNDVTFYGFVRYAGDVLIFIH